MKKAVIIEDDNISQKYIRLALQDVVDLHFADNGKDGLALIYHLEPDIIILDVELPDANGYELCHEIRHHSQFLFTPILFLTGHTSLDERIKGYSAGGDDYMTKPFESSEVVAKVTALLRNHEQKVNLQSQFKEAQSTAIESMTGASELGLIVQFFEKTYAISTFEQLASSIFHIFKSLELKTCLIFDTKEESLFFSSEAISKPLEKELMMRLREEDRFFDFGHRTQINYPVVACLVKNMPMDDPARYGRYKDVIPPILACANQKVMQLEMEMRLQEHTVNFSDSFKNIRMTLDDLANQMRTGQESGSTLLNELLTSLESAMPTLGLDEDQEIYLMRSIESKVNEAMAKVQSYETIQITFDSLIRLLQHLVDDQESLVDELVSKDGLAEEQGPENTNQDSDDVELF
ncbi:MAG: response regulator [Bermanella sp.]